jgi:hypothetical protein
LEQCQFLLQDKRAKVNHDSNDMPEMCNRLLCRLDEAGTNGYFAAGPALEGTACRNDSKANTAFCIQVSASLMSTKVSRFLAVWAFVYTY